MKMFMASPNGSLMLLSIVTAVMTTTPTPTPDNSTAYGAQVSSNATAMSTNGDQSSPKTSQGVAASVNTTTSSPLMTTTTQLTSASKSRSMFSSLMQGGDAFQAAIGMLATEDIRHWFLKPQRVSQRCYDDMVDFIDALIGERQNGSSKEYTSKAWAAQMADAMGKPPAGLLRGARHAVGNYDECLDVHAKIPNGTYLGSRQTARNVSSEFRGKYCRVQVLILPPDVSFDQVMDNPKWKAKVKSFILNWGVCLPESCESEDVKDLLTTGTLETLQLPIYDVMCLKRDRDLASDGWAVFAICLLSLAGLVVLICTVVESAIHYEFIPLSIGPVTTNENGIVKIGSTTDSNTHSKDNGAEKSEIRHGLYNDKTPLSIDKRPLDMLKGEVTPKPLTEHPIDNKDVKSTLAMRLLEAFSIRYNGRKIMCTSTFSDPNMIMCVEGIRVISIGWIILGHSYGLVNFNENNIMFSYSYDVKKTFERLSFTFVPGANMAVDSFFVISGLLVMKITLKELRRGKVQGVRFWIMFYLHRLWRLTPVYMMVLMTGTTLYDYLVEGPLKSTSHYMFDTCESNWWSNLIYVNNFYKVYAMCMPWTWYMAVDMQLFWISPIFILLVHKKYRIGLLVLVATILLGSLTTFLVTLDNPGIFDTVGVASHPEFIKNVYLKPWSRIATFTVGMLLGVILQDASDKAYFSKLKAFVIWIALTCAAIFVILIPHDEMKHLGGQWAKGTMALYESVSRLVWSTYVAWVIYACQSGLGGIATDFLTWTGFQPLAKLTYTVYLVHPLVIVLLANERNSPIELQDTVMICLFCGNMVLSYLLAALYALLFESPLLALEKIVLKKK